jgi:DNA-binding transcriptional ArsR family regulator
MASAGTGHPASGLTFKLTTSGGDRLQGDGVASLAAGGWDPNGSRFARAASIKYGFNRRRGGVRGFRCREPNKRLDKLAKWLNSKAVDMTKVTQAKYANQARIIKALAHPTRLFIVDELARGERCVCELKDMIGVEMPTVSRHLGVLKSAGILEDEKRGLQVFYRLRVPCVLNFFKCVEAVQQNGKRPQPNT